MSRITCKICGEKNERKFDKCWNCEWPLDGGERQRATRQDVRLEGNSLMGVTPAAEPTYTERAGWVKHDSRVAIKRPERARGNNDLPVLACGRVGTR